ncbi:inositol monophosphatase [Candidatus Woesearchaeota archaeon]|nr:inositol monophosphatase [Candidatus Woesearchaeota archaeon]
MSMHLEVAKKAAKKAGILLLRQFGKKVVSYRKHGLAYVTDADFKSQTLIKRILKQATPSFNIISEEAEIEQHGSEYTWYIDPLDGTHNFIHNLPEFGISIALAYGNEIIAGVIYIPFQGRMYYAEKGKGAYLNGKKIHVSSRTSKQRYILMIELEQATRSSTTSLMRIMIPEKNRLRAFACATYSLANLASGNIDAYVTLKTHPWDVAAGMVLVQEAGGKFTTLRGKKGNVNDPGLIFSNGKVHERVLSLSRKAGL